MLDLLHPKATCFLLMLFVLFSFSFFFDLSGICDLRDESNFVFQMAASYLNTSY